MVHSRKFACLVHGRSHLFLYRLGLGLRHGRPAGSNFGARWQHHYGMALGFGYKNVAGQQIVGRFAVSGICQHVKLSCGLQHIHLRRRTEISCFYAGIQTADPHQGRAVRLTCNCHLWQIIIVLFTGSQGGKPVWLVIADQIIVAGGLHVPGNGCRRFRPPGP